jgi:hypothetical protein
MDGRVVVAALIAASGWIVAALVVGLWLGERGRRKDVQWRTRTIRPPNADTAVSSVVNPDLEPGAGIVGDEVRDAMIEDTMREAPGISRRDAERDVDEMLSAMARFGPRMGG